MGHLLSFRQVLSCPVGSGSRNRSVDSAEATTALLAANWFALEDQQRGEPALMALSRDCVQVFQLCLPVFSFDFIVIVLLLFFPCYCFFPLGLCTGVPAVPPPFTFS